MRGPAETIGTTMGATAIAIDRVIESNVGTVVAADDRARLGLFKYFDLRGGRLANPLDRVGQPGIRRIFDVAHVCNPVLWMKHRIAEALLDCQYKVSVCTK